LTLPLIRNMVPQWTPTFDCYEDDKSSPSRMSDSDDINNEHDVDTYEQYVGSHVRDSHWG
jgi:hypothetical protein